MRFQRSKVSTYTRVSSLCKSAVPLNFRGTKVSQRETLVQTAVIFEEMTIGSRRQNESVNQTC